MPVAVTLSASGSDWRPYSNCAKRSTELTPKSPATISPVVQALYNYLQLDTEAEGRAFLLTQADLLLTDEAEAAMAEFWGHGPESQAHVERFQALLERVRRETKTN